MYISSKESRYDKYLREYRANGHTVREIAEMLQLPVDFVVRRLDKMEAK